MTHILARPTTANQADEALRRAKADDARRAAGSPGTGPSLAAQTRPCAVEMWQCRMCGSWDENPVNCLACGTYRAL